MRVAAVALISVLLLAPWARADGNAFAYLDEPTSPYYVGREVPKLTTPQWVGEPGVKAVVVLAIDDLRGLKPDGVEKFETYLRPILDRLKRIDGRAPVSIMSCQVDPQNAHLQTWLKEGVSLEVHTYDHPCPVLKEGDFAKAKATYDQCVDQLFAIPGNVPVAFRTPCCDSRNTVSPRTFAEIFDATTKAGRFLQIDSSVFNVTTPRDASLPRELVLDPDGKERFRKYLPFESFVNTVDDYPYPYLIGRLCWEFPCAVPSDWEAQNLHKRNNPRTVEDWKAQLDATVIKEGTFNFVFHPHAWSGDPQQLVDFIDYAVAKHGKAVKFLTFKECLDRLNKQLLGGQAVRDERGRDSGIRLMDLNGDGYMDVVSGGPILHGSRVWEPEKQTWREEPFPTAAIDQHGNDARLRFGRVGGKLCVISPERAWFYSDGKWTSDLALFSAEPGDADIYEVRDKLLRDLDGDGSCELVVDLGTRGLVFRWTGEKWERLPFQLPDDTTLVSRQGGDAGVRFCDIDEDGRLDLLISRPDRYALHLFESMEKGWGAPILAGKRGEKAAAEEIPPIVRADGTSNGFFIHSRQLVWQNEETDKLPALIDRRAFDDLLKDRRPSPKTPAAALKSFRLRPGFEIELVAAEPLVMDPVAFAWGADGKLWVAEMGDYPLGADGNGAAGGVIRFLTDKDGDGKYDTSTVFLDKVPFPTGVTPWRKGVLVCAAPDLFYAEDTDGDGKADRREVLFTGFGEGNQQHRFNGLVYGLDNWFYGANGDSGGVVKSTKTGKTVDLGRGKDFRLNPDTGEIEPETGASQYGRTRDDWGNWFGCNNSNPNYHFVMPDRYLRRNPHAAGTVDPKSHVPQVPGAAPVFPASKLAARFNDYDRANRITSANGLCIYRDDLFGPAFTGNSFVSEPVHNLVHREVMEPKGATFTSRRAKDEQTSEFLASTDPWFRPAQLKTGPDGALWVADMYRDVIEHPQWIPREWQVKLDLRAGHDKGRIYRVFPTGTVLHAIPRLDQLDTAGLVAALDSPSSWQRDMAQQLLVERQDKAGVPWLAGMVRERVRPEARLHAMSTLEGLGALDEGTLRVGLRDDHPGVVRRAVLFCEPLLGVRKDGVPYAELLDLISANGDPSVRLQLALTLGEDRASESAGLLARLASEGRDDPYLIAAVISSITPARVAPTAQAVASGLTGPAPVLLIVALARMAAEGGDAASVGQLVRLAAYGPERGSGDVDDGESSPNVRADFVAAARVLDALDAGGTLPPAILLAVTAGAPPDRSDVLRDARRAVDNPQEPEARRAAAVTLLGRTPECAKEDHATLVSLTGPTVPPALRSAAVESLARIGTPDALDHLIKSWRSFGPADRGAVLDALLSRKAGTEALLVALKAGEIRPRDVDAERRQRLLRHNNTSVRARAEAAFAEEVVSKDRQKVIDNFAPSLTTPGDPAKGKAHFEKLCANCHKLGEMGHAVGPDLAGLADPSPSYLLTHILDPNRAVEAKYANYVIETTRGQTYSGVLSAEAGDSVTILQANGLAQTVARADVKRLRDTGLSLMPEGLEVGMNPADMADLMAFIKPAKAGEELLKPR